MTTIVEDEYVFNGESTTCTVAKAQEMYSRLPFYSVDVTIQTGEEPIKETLMLSDNGMVLHGNKFKLPTKLNGFQFSKSLGISNHKRELDQFQYPELHNKAYSLLPGRAGYFLTNETKDDKLSNNIFLNLSQSSSRDRLELLEGMEVFIDELPVLLIKSVRNCNLHMSSSKVSEKHIRTHSDDAFLKKFEKENSNSNSAGSMGLRKAGSVVIDLKNLEESKRQSEKELKSCLRKPHAKAKKKTISFHKSIDVASGEVLFDIKDSIKKDRKNSKIRSTASQRLNDDDYSVVTMQVLNGKVRGSDAKTVKLLSKDNKNFTIGSSDQCSLQLARCLHSLAAVIEFNGHCFSLVTSRINNVRRDRRAVNQNDTSKHSSFSRLSLRVKALAKNKAKKTAEPTTLTAVPEMTSPEAGMTSPEARTHNDVLIRINTLQKPHAVGYDDVYLFKKSATDAKCFMQLRVRLDTSLAAADSEVFGMVLFPRIRKTRWSGESQRVPLPSRACIVDSGAGDIVVGCHPRATVSINDFKLSLRHTLLYHSKKQLLVASLSGSKATWLELGSGDQVYRRPHRLKTNDRFKVGKNVFRVVGMHTPSDAAADETDAELRKELSQRTKLLYKSCSLDLPPAQPASSPRQHRDSVGYWDDEPVGLLSPLSPVNATPIRAAAAAAAELPKPQVISEAEPVPEERSRPISRGNDRATDDDFANLLYVFHLAKDGPVCLLQCIKGTEQGKFYQCHPHETVLGRNKHKAHICLSNDELVSPVHARLSYDYARCCWQLEDAHSFNGTWLRVGSDSRAVRPGDYYSVGETTFRVLLERVAHKKVATRLNSMYKIQSKADVVVDASSVGCSPGSCSVM